MTNILLNILLSVLLLNVCIMTTLFTIQAWEEFGERRDKKQRDTHNPESDR